MGTEVGRQLDVIPTITSQLTTVRQQQQQEQLRKRTIQTTIQHCVHLNSGPATFLIPRTTWKTNQEPWTTTTPQSRGTKQQQRPQPNNHQDFFLRFTRLKHVLLVPVPPISTRTRRTTS